MITTASRHLEHDSCRSSSSVGELAFQQRNVENSMMHSTWLGEWPKSSRLHKARARTLSVASHRLSSLTMHADDQQSVQARQAALYWSYGNFREDDFPLSVSRWRFQACHSPTEVSSYMLERVAGHEAKQHCSRPQRYA